MILITGCAGYLGSRLAAELLSEGKRVAGIALEKDREKLTPLIRQGLRVFYYDITQDEFIYEVKKQLYDKVDVIYHMTGLHSSSEKMQRLYVTGTENVLKLAEKLYFPICIIAGNSSIYCNYNDDLLTEDLIQFHKKDITFNHPFGKITFEMEWLCKWFLKQIPVIMLRIGQVYGEDTKELVNKLSSRTYSLLGDGENFQSYIHEKDLIKILICAPSKLIPGESYNVSDYLPVKQKEYYIYLADQYRVPMPVWKPYEVMDQRIQLSIHGLKALSLKMSSLKLRNQLNWEFNYPTFKDGLINNKKEEV